MKKNRAGFTIIELVIFIVILGIVASVSYTGINEVLYQIISPQSNIQASFLANSRLEAILLNRRISGYTGFSDPCATGNRDICSPLSRFATNYNFTVTVPSPSSFPLASNTTNANITVQVTGTGNAKIMTKVWNY